MGAVLALSVGGSALAAPTETVLYAFQGGSDGSDPSGQLLMDHSGNLYGTTTTGGLFQGLGSAFGSGTVYKISPSGQYSVLYRFNGGTDGLNPSAGLIADEGGNLYGTTQLGGTTGGVEGTLGNGTVFKLSPSGQYSVLYRFKGTTDG
ncbi:MAG TPA: choice-of-anchor tandem repeat GloVer-containing protein, partial [Methylocella sp.]|nr:choice-of-anchor tandem repeat GloVer-containing protein [Methylocella sp.]